ncbi:MAG: hypothetical protein GF341_10905 [candidate division Zixibacteria bacterium]|nr:hypothetical protein [candidate division Zixibacteria bacterium]
MHRIGRVMLVSVVCLMLAWPSLGLAYIDRDRIVDAHPIRDGEDNQMTGAAPESGDTNTMDTTESFAQSYLSWLPDVLVLRYSWDSHLSIVLIPAD